MNIYEAIDRCNISLNELTPEDRYQIKEDYDQHTWIKAAKLFLKGIGNKHSVSSEVIRTLYDMCHEHDDGRKLNHKQLLYISNNLIDNWHQVNYEIKSLLYI